MDLSKIIADEMAEVLSPEAIQAKVKENLDALVSETVKEAFRSWRDTPGRTLADKITAALNVEVEKVDLSSAALGVVSVVEQEVAKHLREQVDPVVEQRIAALFKPAPRTWDLDDLVGKYRDAMENRRDRDGDRIGLVINVDRDGWVDVGLHPVPRRDALSRGLGYVSMDGKTEPVPFHACDIGIRLKAAKGSDDYELWHLRVGDQDTGDSIQAPALTLDAIGRQLYQAFVAGTRFTIHSLDAEDYYDETVFPDACEC